MAGFRPTAPRRPGFDYHVGDTVMMNDEMYSCRQSHMSTSFEADLKDKRVWRELGKLGPRPDAPR